MNALFTRQFALHPFSAFLLPLVFVVLGIFLLYRIFASRTSTSAKYLLATVLVMGTFVGAILSSQELTDFKGIDTMQRSQISPSPAVAGTTAIPSFPSSTPTLTSSSKTTSTREMVRVIKVVDGDTVQLEGNRTLRYIGIDTPETVDPRRPAQCFGKEASMRNKELVEGKIVGLEKDVSETDKFGRLLRYVYLEETMIQEQLVREGFAFASSYPPDVKYQARLKAAEQHARQTNIGLWSTCELPVTKTPQASGGINTSGDKDCSDFATQQEAQAYFTERGGSATNNVDKLDGSDSDGRVCETLP